MSNVMQERRVILIGKSGTGKSSTGNTLLGSKVFDAELGFNSVTKECVEGRFVDHNKNLTYICVDTPGLFDSSDKLAETALKIQSSVTKHCHKPHAFLLVLEATRFNHEDCLTLGYLQMMFGKEICKHLIIVVTHGERFQSDDHFMKKLKENDPLWDFIKKCGGRVIRIENESNSKQTARENLEETIEKLSRNGKKVYLCKYLSTCSEALAESLANYKGPKDIDKQLQDIHERLKGKLSGWEPVLTGVGIGVVLTGGVAAAAAVMTITSNPAAAGAVVAEITAQGATRVAEVVVSNRAVPDTMGIFSLFKWLIR